MNVPEKLQWQALNHIKPEKTADWFWIVGITAIAISVLSIYFENFLFALLILIGVFATYMQSHIPPHIINFEISRRGIVSGKTLYPFTTLESFCVVDEDGWDRDRILIKSKKVFMPLITVPLGQNVTPEMAQTFLTQFMKEEHLEEPTFQKVMDRLGF
jgi:hypothetical protein